MGDLVPEKRFPLLWPHGKDGKAAREWAERVGCPMTLPWDLVAIHEPQAKRNHDQSVARLAERGGLSPHEALAVITNRGFREVSAMHLVDVMEALRVAVAQHEGQEAAL